MRQNKENKNKKRKPASSPAFSNDQLGENASEEFRSESYSNAQRTAKDKKKSK